MASDQLDTSEISKWRSIVTLVVFIFANIIVLFPFHISIYVPRILRDYFLYTLSALRIISPRPDDNRSNHGSNKTWVRLRFPMNYLTAPLIGDLFLLAIQAIGRQEVLDGTIGADDISPIDIMAFFITLAYVAISIDASGLVRYLAFMVLKWGGKVGHRLFFYLYAFFFGLGTLIGNDPIILSGTAFLAYMTRVSTNIVHPRAWVYSQFAVANIASAILVSSNPTNLVLAGAFGIRFIDYTLNMIVPVIVTAIVLFPFLLYIVFADEALIPISIERHELPQEVMDREPVNPNIPNARRNIDAAEDDAIIDEQNKLLSLEEIMNPFLDKGGAVFGSAVMVLTLVSLLALNAASEALNIHPRLFWVTVPAAFIMICWDLGFGWANRHETRLISRKGREEAVRSRIEREFREEEESKFDHGLSGGIALGILPSDMAEATPRTPSPESVSDTTPVESAAGPSQDEPLPPEPIRPSEEEEDVSAKIPSDQPPKDAYDSDLARETDMQLRINRALEVSRQRKPRTLETLIYDWHQWLQETFPTVMAVLGHLPFLLVPFAFAMFVLVQALVTKGWVPVFAYGWDHWVHKTGTIGAISGMGFLSVILCNFAGTNIGATILLSRIIQDWVKRHDAGNPLSQRTFWATVYTMALGVNYGAFSTAISASLAGLLWQDILARKHIHVRGLDFARVNLPIISVSMIVGCTVLVGEVYIMRNDTPYKPKQG